MTNDEFNDLEEGDIIQNSGSERRYVVIGWDRTKVLLQRIDLAAENASEWSLRIKRPLRD